MYSWEYGYYVKITDFSIEKEDDNCKVFLLFTKNLELVETFCRTVQYLYNDYTIARVASVSSAFATRTRVLTTWNASTATRATSTRRSLCCVWAWTWAIAFFTILFLYKRIKISLRNIIIIIYFFSLSNILILFYIIFNFAVISFIVLSSLLVIWRWRDLCW